MATAKKMPNGKWKVQVYIGKDQNGKRKYKWFSDYDKRRCERMASEYVDEHRVVEENGTFAKYLESYLTAKTPILSASTIRGYKCTQRYLKLHYEAFYRAKAASIDRDALQRIVNDMAEYVSPKSVRNHYGLITAVLKYSGYHVPEITLPARQKPGLHIPDTNVVQEIIKACEGTEMEIPVLLAAFGGMRRSEICALKLDDIQGNVIHIQRAVVLSDDRELVVKDTKTTDSNRYVPISEEIIDKIRKKGCITKIKTPNGITKRFEQITEKIGYKGIRFHDLRHWNASYLHSQNVPDIFILSRNGWRTDYVMKNVYRHELASEKNKWNQEINNAFKKIIESD